MRVRHVVMAALSLAVLACAAAGFAYESERTPEYALEQVAEGIADKDYNQVARYVDVTGLVTAGYDESTAKLSRDIKRLNETYPQDWFFYHEPEFMTDYIAARRNDDLVFIQRIIELYMDPAIRPVSSSDGQAKWLADEVQKFYEEYDASLGEVVKDASGERAVAEVKIKGHDSAYGHLVPELSLQLELQQQEDGHWLITRVANVEEVFDPVVKGIEDYWDLQGWPVREVAR